MRAETYIKDGDDILDVSFVELDEGDKRHVRLTFEFADDIQVHLKDGAPYITYYNSVGKKVESIIGRDDVIPF